MIQSWVQALISQQVAGNSLTNTAATATSIIAPAAKFTIPANFFYIGSVLRVTMTGQLSNVVTTPGTLTLDFMFGAVIVFTTGAMQMSTTAHTTLPFWWDVLLTCRAIGASTSANLMGQSKIHGQMMLTSGADITTHGTLLAPNTTPAVGTGFDSTLAQVTDVKATTSVGTTGTIVTGQQLVIESLN
jgi:hypothetical protein